MLKNTLTIILLFLFCFNAKSNVPIPPLQPGDLAIVGINNKGGSAELAIVALKTISVGTSFNLTDRAWQTNQTFSNIDVDGVATLTTTQVIPAGTVFNLFITGGSQPSVTSPQNLGSLLLIGWTGANIAGNGGDSWLIYTGTDQSPQFVYGLANWTPAKPGGNDPDPITGWTNNNTTTGTTSNLPEGLKSGPYYNTLTITGQNFFLYNAYNGSFIGTKELILNNLRNASIWAKSSSTASDLRPSLGNAFTGSQPIFTLPSAAPATISSVSSGSGNSTYIAGQTISLQVNFTEAVSVSGTPTLLLNTNGIATYASGSGTSSLTFSYVVQAGQNTPRLDYSGSNALSITGATIKNSSGDDAILTLPGPGAAGSLGANSNIVVNTNAPTVTSITRLSPSTANTNTNNVTFLMTFSEPITGLDVSDFTLTGTGIDQAQITSLAGYGTTWQINVNTGVSGTLRLDLKNTGTGIQNLAGTPIQGGFTAGEAYNISRNPAILNQVTMVSNNITNNKRAIAGNTVTLAFNSNNPINIISVTIYGVMTTLKPNPTGGWLGEYTFNGFEPDGPVLFEIYFRDPVWNMATVINTPTDEAPVLHDRTPPTIQIISYTSDLPDKPTLAGAQSRVTLSGTFSEAVSGYPLITIAGYPVTPTMLSPVSFTVDYYISQGAQNGLLPFTIDFKDQAGNPGGQVSNVSTGKNITVDQTAPAYTSVTIASNNPNPKFAKAGDIVTLSFSANEPIGTATVMIDYRIITGTLSADKMSWTGTLPISSDMFEGPLNLFITFGDLTGNAGPGTFNTTDGSMVQVDMTPPLGPNNLSVKAGDRQIQLSWLANTDAVKYELIGGEPLALGTNVLSTITGGDITPEMSFTHTGLTNSTYYYYALRATDAAGNSSTSDVIFIGRPVNNQVITFTQPQPAEYGSSFTVNATSSAGLPVLLTSSEPLVATISGSTVTVIGSNSTRSVSITASQSGDADHPAATAVTRVLQIKPKPITITAVAKSKEYGSPDPGFSGVSEVLLFEDDFTGSVTRNPGEDVGTYVIDPSGLLLDPNKYAVTYVPANLTITKKPVTITSTASYNKIFNRPDPVMSYVIPNSIPAHLFSGNIGRIPGEDVGSYPITLGDLSAGQNYELTLAPEQNFMISPLTINVTPIGRDKTYGDPDPGIGYHYNPGIRPIDSFTGMPGRSPGENVGLYTINQGTLELSPNYILLFTNPTALSLTIVPKIIDINPAVAQGKTYGDPDGPILYTANTSLLNGDTFSGMLGREAGTAVGNYLINNGNLSISNAQNAANYTLNFNPANEVYAIRKKPITVTASAAQKVFGTSDPSAFSFFASTDLLPGNTFSGRLERIPGETVGDYNIEQGSLAIPSGNYDISYVGTKFSIAKQQLTITPKANLAKVYSENDPASLGYDISPNIPGITITGSLNRTPGEAVGVYDFNLGNLSAGSGYNLVLNNTPKFSITKQRITVVPITISKIYGEPAVEPNYTFSPALKTGDSFTGKLSSPIVTANSNVGKYPFGIGTLALSDNYELVFSAGAIRYEITPKPIKITPTANQGSGFGESLSTISYTHTEFSSINGDQLTGALGIAGGTNAGQHQITLGNLGFNNGASNYELQLDAENYTINKKTINVTATAASKVYGAIDPALIYTFSPELKSGDSFTGSLVRAAGENVNTYAIGKGDLALNSNYTLNYTAANFTIGLKAINVTATAASKVYGSVDPALIYTFSPELKSGDSFTGSLSRAAGENVNTYAIGKGDLALNSNYTLNYTPANFTIGLKAINVIATAASKVYGALDPALTYTFSPQLKSGDSFTGSLSRAAGENVNTYAIGKGDLALSSNYTLNYTPANFTIGSKTINVIATAASKIYGSLDPALTYTFSPELKSGENFSGSLSRAAGENVNTYAIGKGDLTLNSNYTLNYTPANFTIGLKAINVTATAASKVYGSVDPALIYTFSPELKSGDSFTGSLVRAAGENVNTYAIGKGDLALNSNYTLNYSPADFTISKKTINVTATAASKVYGSQDPALIYTFSPELKSGDKFTGSLVRAAGENVNTYAISQGNLALSTNYTLNYSPANFTISPAPLTITAENKDKFAGTLNPTFTAKYEGFVNGESATVFSSPITFQTTATTNSPMGSYDIVPSGATANNYVITFVKGVLNVKAAAPTNVLFAGSTIYENQPSGTLAGQLSSTSEDPNAKFTFSLVSGSGDTDNASFRIDGNQLFTAASLDYENKSIYSVRVKSTTQYGFSLEKTFTMNLIDVNESPTLDMIANKTICYTNSTQSIDLTGISSGPETGQNNKITVVGNNPDLLQNLTVSGSGSKGTISYRVKNGASGISTITVTVKDDGGTDNGGVDTYSRTFVLTVNALPIVEISADKGINNNGNSTDVSKGETVVLSASGGSTYSWATHNSVINGLKTANLMVRPRETTTYTLTVSNANGCTEQKSFTINVLDDLQKIKATNILTPNGDGYNDKWIVDNIDLYPNNEVKIFDKSGRMIYGKKGYDNSWDGMLNGVPLAEGTYYYIIDFGKDRLKFKGFITIAREN